jgi:transcriptional regulator with XRE-family HTH domain
MVRIGLRFREARKELGVALQDVANACDVTRQAVSLWETGKAVPGDDKLRRAAEFLGVSRRWLITGEPPKRVEPIGGARAKAERTPAWRR